MTEDGYVPVTRQTLETRFPGVYAVGDVATVGVPKAGVFSEGAARVVAASLIARVRDGEEPRRLRRSRLVLRRVRRGPGRSRRRRLLLRAEADRRVPGAVRRARRREGAVRLEPPRPLVRRVAAHHRAVSLRADAASTRRGCPGPHFASSLQGHYPVVEADVAAWKPPLRAYAAPDKPQRAENRHMEGIRLRAARCPCSGGRRGSPPVQAGGRAAV